MMPIGILKIWVGGVSGLNLGLKSLKSTNPLRKLQKIEKKS
jgi:hypothetical protein